MSDTTDGFPSTEAIVKAAYQRGLADGAPKLKRAERMLDVVERLASKAAAGKLDAGPVAALESIERYIRVGRAA